jgi:hypothetical protein
MAFERYPYLHICTVLDQLLNLPVDNLSILNMNESDDEFIHIIVGFLVNFLKTYIVEPWYYRWNCDHLTAYFSKIKQFTYSLKLFD